VYQSARRAAAVAVAIAVLLSAAGNASGTTDRVSGDSLVQPPGKAVVYQVFTRLFGNRQTRNRPWGTLEDNGVGKFADINAAALEGIRDLGVTHVWYTGVLHHASVTDYSAHGIPADDPEVVKGRAGSPYAIRDYYNVDPDLASVPERRLDEFRDLIDRSHAAGLRVLIDIVPNHVARRYRSLAPPPGVRDFGADDDRSVTYARDNNFYYVVGEDFEVPDFSAAQRPLGGEAHPLIDGRFDERPARWTGNGARRAKPSADDWYETVRINYGVRPDGSHDFPALPTAYEDLDHSAHLAFWEGRDLPDSWYKMRDIALYWLAQGVDGFRYDMAELVPVEFWSFLNASIRARLPDALLIAEVYQPALYRDYLRRGLMDQLYAKVDLYDTLFAVVRGERPAREIAVVHRSLADIDDHLLTFLENHDELRIASPGFAGDARRGLPAMAVSALLWRGATMLYFAQELGEAALGDPGFGEPWDTTIFDYWGVPAQQRWMNAGRFDGGALTQAERQLRADYASLLRVARDSPAMRGDTLLLHDALAGENERLFAFLRRGGGECLIVLANFSSRDRASNSLMLSRNVLEGCGSTLEHRAGNALSLAPDRIPAALPSFPVDLPPLGWQVISLHP
jgi:glycosidase